MSPSINQLRAFVLSVRTGSFTATAEELFMAQASVSELIRRMESEYGLPLFVRSGRRLLLTSAGAELLPFAEQTVTAVDRGDQALRSLRSLTGGVATFGVLRNAGYYLLADLAQRFHELYPEVRVRLIGQNSIEVAESVVRGELEAGLVVLPIDDEGLQVTPLMRDEVVYASASPEKLLAPVSMQQLAQAELILYDAHYGWRDPTRRQFAQRAQLLGLKLEARIEVEHVESALNLVARHVGDTMICRAVAESSALPSNIGIVSFVEPIYDTIALIERESSIPSPATRELMALAQEMLLAGAIERRALPTAE